MKLGIYGGSFNPPHLGHLNAAVTAAKFLGLDRLLMVPAGIPPHKALAEGSPQPEHRAAMTEFVAEQAALETGIPVQVTRMELEREGKSYTADTVREVHEQYPDAELWVLMGTDMFLTFRDWHKPEAILEYAGICAFGRNKSDTEEQLAVQRGKLEACFPHARIVTTLLPNLVEVSSSELRDALREGDAEKYLTPQVYGYILREHLYGTDLDLKNLTPDQLRPIALSFLKAKRVRHVLGVEEEALRLARMYGVDTEKARVAALLHDCTKKLDLQSHLALCERYGVALDEMERGEDKLLHAKTGAAIAREVFGADPEVCEAICWHTTGKADMSTLEKVIYLADYMEPNRDFDGVDELRRATYESLEKGLEMGLRMSIEDLKRRGRPLHRNTREAYECVRAFRETNEE